MATDLVAMVNVEQEQNRILNRLVLAFQAGILLDPTPTSYAVASLPATAADGQVAWASNGRKGAEGPGAGTGILVYYNPSTATWFTVAGNVVVTA